MRVFGLSVIVSGCACAASAFTAVNGINAFTEGGDARFEVISERGAGPREIWCAAAQYARGVLGEAPNTRIYLAREIGPSPQYDTKNSASFTTRPDSTLAPGPRPGDGGNYSVSLKTTGYSLRLAHAEGFCPRIIEEWID